jgi:hypothetical protein
MHTFWTDTMCEIHAAELFVECMADGGDRILAPHSGIMRGAPVRGSLKPGLLQSYDDIDAHFQRHER